MNKIKKYAFCKIIILITLLILDIMTFSKNLNASQIDATHKFYLEASKLADLYPKETEEEYLYRTTGVYQSIDRIPPQLGEVVEFYCYNVTTMQPYKIKATLKKIGKHCYIYLENGKFVPSNVIENIAYKFDEKIYPTCLKYFGDVWNPGIDGDPRITLLLLDIQDNYGVNGNRAYTSGYFNAMDEFSRRINQFSNMREMLYLDIYPTNPNSDQFLGVIAHELQHMIHWNYDPKEHIWLNEAFSQLSVFLNGFGHPSQLLAFIRNSDNNLISWSTESAIENYGQVYLFLFYLMSRFSEFGKQPDFFLRSIVANKKHGLESIDEVLKKFKSKYTIAQMFGGFCVANFVNDATIANGFYAYGRGLSNFRLPPSKKFLLQPFSTISKVKLWSAKGYYFDVSNYKKSKIKISFTGQKGNGNIFDLAFVLIDSSKRTKPSVEWVRAANYKFDNYINLQVENHDTLWLIICHRGPIGRFEQKIAQSHPPAEFSFTLMLVPTSYNNSREYSRVNSNRAGTNNDRRKSAYLSGNNLTRQYFRNILEELSKSYYVEDEVFSSYQIISDFSDIYNLHNEIDVEFSRQENQSLSTNSRNSQINNQNPIQLYNKLLALEEFIISELRKNYENKTIFEDLIAEYCEFFSHLDDNAKKKVYPLHSKVKDLILYELKYKINNNLFMTVFLQ